MSKTPVILGIETSSTLCSVCFWSRGKLLASAEEDIGFGHASVFFSLLGRLEKEASCTLQDITHVAVTRGPGSFTGIRVGLSIAKGFAFAGNLPLLGLTTFEVARHSLAFDGPTCVALDTKRQDFYAAFEGLEDMPPPGIFSKEDILAVLEKHSDVRLISDSLISFPDLKSACGLKLTSRDVAHAAEDFLKAESASFSSEPFYLRPPKVYE